MRLSLASSHPKRLLGPVALVLLALVFSLFPAITAIANTGPTLTISTPSQFIGINSRVSTTSFSPATEIDYLQRTGFHYYDWNNELVANQTFGTFKVLSQRPFRVQYTVNSGRVWSDGTPITAVDLLLHHATCSTKYLAAANLGTLNSNPNNLAFDSTCYSRQSANYLNSIPTLSADKMTLTVDFDRAYTGWREVLATPFPVHALVLLAEGSTRLPTESAASTAKAKFEKAFFGLDTKSLREYGYIWSNSYKLTNIDSNTNPLLLVSNGGYMVESANSQQIVMKYNERYNSGPAVQGISKIVIKVLADQTAAAQAFSRGELDVHLATPTPDSVALFRALNNARVVGFGASIYEHLDMRVWKSQSSNAQYNGVFAGDTTKARELRKAFLLALPRDEIVDRLIKPINSNAQRLDSLFYFPEEDRYRNAVASNGIATFTQGTATQREAEALRLVQKYYPSASASNPVVPVNLLWGSPTNSRRSSVAQLIKSAAARAGFNVNAPGVQTWSSQLNSSDYDASFFAWVRSEGDANRNLDFYCTACVNNFSGWSNSSVDAATKKVDESALNDGEVYIETLNVEKIINEAHWSIPLYQHPGAYVINANLRNFKPGASTLSGLWNYWEWTLPGAQPFALYNAQSNSAQGSSQGGSQNSTEIKPNSDHQEGWVRVNFGGEILRANSSIELEFTPADLPPMSSTLRWSVLYHLGFCWNKETSYGAGNACGYMGWGLHSQSGDTYFGNFDFGTWEGQDFNAANLRSGVSCSTGDPSARVAGAKYVVCWTGIQVLENNRYSFKLSSDDKTGSNWWIATITNLTNGMIWEVGRIKMLGNDLNRPLSWVEFVQKYYGDAKECNAVPVHDSFLNAPKINGKTLSYAGYQVGSCARAVASSNQNSAGDYLIRFGGNSPETRAVSSASLVTTGGSTNLAPKLTNPTFSGVNFTGNKINISVNIGSAASSRPDKIYLVAPKLGISSTNPQAGVISGSTATWAINFDKLLAGTMIPLEIVGEKDGVKTEPLIGSYQAPEAIAATNQVPLAPTDFKARIVGSSALITAKAKLKSGALPKRAFIYGKSLGISKSNAIPGDVLGTKVVLEVPVKASMAGKRYPVTIYLANEKGDSKPLNATLVIPAAPKAPSLPSGATNLPKAPETVICSRGSQTRAFAGDKCPPGWSET